MIAVLELFYSGLLGARGILSQMYLFNVASLFTKIPTSSARQQSFKSRSHPHLTVDACIYSDCGAIWRIGQFIEIANIESNKSLILGNVYRPSNNTTNIYQSFTNEFIPILENLQRANRETIIAGDVNIDLLKINNNATLGNYFDSVVAQSFFHKLHYLQGFQIIIVL